MKMATRGKKKTSVAELCENLGILEEEKQCLKKGASILCTYTRGWLWKTKGFGAGTAQHELQWRMDLAAWANFWGVFWEIAVYSGKLALDSLLRCYCHRYWPWKNPWSLRSHSHLLYSGTANKSPHYITQVDQDRYSLVRNLLSQPDSWWTHLRSQKE